jgi:outer membrane protein assembly factor BamE
MNTLTMRRAFILVVLATLLSGCLTIYKVEVQQGNVVTQDMVDKLKPGMTRSQVRFALGTPLIADPFHPDRWDYYYFLRPMNKTEGESRRVTILFKNDALVAIQNSANTESGNSPADATAPKPAAPDTAPKKIPSTPAPAL